MDRHKKYSQCAKELTEWLLSPAIRTQQGEVLSWQSNREDGFFYPEITGYCLNLLLYLEGNKQTDRDLLPAAQKSAQCLINCLNQQNGTISKDNYAYVFDTGIVLKALFKAQEKINIELPCELTEKALTFITQALCAKTAGYPTQKDAPKPRWSNSYSPHLLKILPLLLQFPQIIPSAQKIARIMIDDFKDSLLREPLYTHLLAYALEGFSGLQASGFSGLDSIIQTGLEILADLQNQDGGIINFSDRRIGSFEVSDATAQAARLWMLNDPQKYQKRIISALDFLWALKAPAGGILYHPHSCDQNACATIFTIQALIFHLSSPSIKELI